MPPPPPPSSFAPGAPNGYDYDTQRFTPGRDVDYAPSNGAGTSPGGKNRINDLNAEFQQRISGLGVMPVSLARQLHLFAEDAPFIVDSVTHSFFCR